MKILGVGDNVLDYYKQQELYYLGGNALNVAVMGKRNGFEKSAFLGIFGNDKASNFIISSLKEEKIDVSRSRHAVGECGIATVSIKNGDRKFIKSNQKTRISSLLRLNLHEEDISYIDYYDIIHTSINSHIDTELKKISHKRISYDFSDNTKWNYNLISQIAPYVTYAFFSGNNLEENEIYELINFVKQFNVEIIVITRGEKSAILSLEDKIYKQNPHPTELKDTMGAGDSFIAGFLSSFEKDRDPKKALNKGASSAAITCSHYGAIGYAKN